MANFLDFLKDALGKQEPPRQQAFGPQPVRPLPLDENQPIRANIVGRTRQVSTDIAAAREEVFNPSNPNSGPRTENVFAASSFVRSLSEGFDKIDSVTQTKLLEIEDPVIKRNIVRAAMVSNQIPLAAIGFDTERFYLDVASKFPAGNYGEYRTGEDAIVTRYLQDKPEQPSVRASGTVRQGEQPYDTLIHESMHRGFDQLRRAYPEEVVEIFKDLDAGEGDPRSDAGSSQVKAEHLSIYRLLEDVGNLRQTRRGEADTAFDEETESGRRRAQALDRINDLARRYQQEFAIGGSNA